jgi:nucleoside-diphosphate-sugar epimerase
MQKVLIVGALGQIGSELVHSLRNILGTESVIASDIRFRSKEVEDNGPFEIVDCTDIRSLAEVVKKYKVDTIYHLAAILSAAAEEKPQFAWNINIHGLYNVLEIAREQRCSVFVPSSIAAFGPNTPRFNTPQDTIQRPTTIYGISKVAGELLCDYFYHRFGVDARGVRYPGIISNKTLPGGGTTDYAVEIYYEAIKHKKYYCYLGPNTKLDMMYMPDAIKAAIKLMLADPAKFKHRNAFNITSMSITPEDIAASIRKFIPEFQMQYRIDAMKQNIANSWPSKIDDTAAQTEWGWQPDYDLDTMTKDMIHKLSEKLEVEIN